MPAFIPIIVGAGASMVAGWAIDEAIGDGEYSLEEAALDGVLGATGAGVVKPVVNIARRGRRAGRIVTGKPASSLEGVAMRASGTWTGKPVGMYANASNRIRLAHGLTYVSRGSRSDLSRLSKFGIISGSHSYLTRDGTGPAINVTSPTDHNGFEARNRRPSTEISLAKRENGEKVGAHAGKARRRRPRRARKAKRRCPPGFFWSYQKRKCVRSLPWHLHQRQKFRSRTTNGFRK